MPPTLCPPKPVPKYKLPTLLSNAAAPQRPSIPSLGSRKDEGPQILSDAVNEPTAQQSILIAGQVNDTQIATSSMLIPPAFPTTSSAKEELTRAQSLELVKILLHGSVSSISPGVSKTRADHNYRSQRLHGRGTSNLTSIVNLTNLRFRGYFSTRHFGNLKLPVDGQAWSYQDCMAQQNGTYTEEHTLKYLKRGDKTDVNRLLDKIVSV